MVVDPEILSGTPVFAGTRVPVHTLMDYLRAGDRVDDFIEDFSTVTRAQVDAVLDVVRVAAGKFEAFITIDSNLSYQQNTSGLSFGVIVLSAPTNRLDDLLPLIPRIIDALESLSPGQIARVGG